MPSANDPIRSELNQMRLLIGKVLSELRELREARLPIQPARDEQGPKLAYTIDEAIAATGIGRSTVYEEIASGALRARKRGRSTIILTGDLSEYLAALPPIQPSALK